LIEFVWPAALRPLLTRILPTAMLNCVMIVDAIEVSTLIFRNSSRAFLVGKGPELVW